MGSGFKTFTAGSVLTASDVNNYLMTQSVMVFASAAARTSAISSPVVGMVSYLSDTGSIEIYYGATSGWMKSWALPWGYMGYAERTSDVTVNTGTVDITGCSVTFTAVANRRYRILGQTIMDSNHGAAQAIDFRIVVDSTAKLVQATQTAANPNPGDTLVFSSSLVTTLSAGSRTVKLQGTFASGSSNAFRAGTDNPSFVLVEDIGPSGNAPVA